MRTPCLLFIAMTAIAAVAPQAQAGLFGGKPKPQPVNIAPQSDDKAQPWHKPTTAEREAAMRGEPLVKATFFARLFDHDPHDYQSGLILSEALRALGRNAEAADVAQRILTLRPDDVEALLAAGRAHIADNNAFYAIDPLKHAIELKSDDWRAWSLLGVAYDQTERPDDATSAFARALKLSPGNPAVLTNMAMSLSTKNRLPEAETLLRQAVAHKDATLQMRQNLALVLGLEGKYAEAEKWLRLDLPPEAVDQNLTWLKTQGSAPAPSSHSWSNLKGG